MHYTEAIEHLSPVPKNISYNEQHLVNHYKQSNVLCYNIHGVQHPWTLFLKTSCIFSRNKATLDNKSYQSYQKCSKKLKYHSSTLADTIVVKLQ